MRYLEEHLTLGVRVPSTYLAFYLRPNKLYIRIQYRWMTRGSALCQVHRSQISIRYLSKIIVLTQEWEYLLSSCFLPSTLDWCYDRFVLASSCWLWSQFLCFTRSLTLRTSAVLRSIFSAYVNLVLRGLHILVTRIVKWLWRSVTQSGDQLWAW